MLHWREKSIPSSASTRHVAEEEPVGSVRVAIVGVGNCASALVQGVEYYKNARDGEFVPGLMQTRLGPYHVGDVAFAAALEIDERKVGAHVAEEVGLGP